jgi:hypothetical protein
MRLGGLKKPRDRDSGHLHPVNRMGYLHEIPFANPATFESTFAWAPNLSGAQARTHPPDRRCRLREQVLRGVTLGTVALARDDRSLNHDNSINWESGGAEIFSRDACFQSFRPYFRRSRLKPSRGCPINRWAATIRGSNRLPALCCLKEKPRETTRPLDLAKFYANLPIPRTKSSSREIRCWHYCRHCGVGRKE